MKKIILNFIIVIALSPISNTAFAYNGPKHHNLMAERAVEESNLDSYLKQNLGFSKGIETKFKNPYENLPEQEKTKSVKEWIMYGSIMEDEGGIVSMGIWRPRVGYHFYDTITDQGLTDGLTVGSSISSLVWGKEHEKNNYSWSKAHDYYYFALTKWTKEERDAYWALTFKSLGQVMHLIQDLASPAHVRNDNHLEGDSYEDWSVSDKGKTFINAIMSSGRGIPALGIPANENYRYPIVRMDRLDDYWDKGDEEGLAEFTNGNFVSKDTNLDKPVGDPHHYDSPRALPNFHEEPYTFTDSHGTERTVKVTYVKSQVNDSYAPEKGVSEFNYLTAISHWNFYTKRHNPSETFYSLNSKCHEEYAKLLVPRAISYSAGILNYFFRGGMNANLEMYYDETICYREKYRMTVCPTSSYIFENLSQENIEVHFDYETYSVETRTYEYCRRGIAHIEDSVVNGDSIVIGFSGSGDYNRYPMNKIIVIYKGISNNEKVILGKVIFLCPMRGEGSLFNENQTYESNSSRYNELRNTAWQEYYSEDYVGASHGQYYWGVSRQELWDGYLPYSVDCRIWHVSQRSYVRIKAKRFSSTKTAKLIGVKRRQSDSDMHPLEFNVLFYRIYPINNNYGNSNYIEIWTKKNESQGELIWQMSNQNLEFDRDYPISIECNPQLFATDQDICFELKTDKEWFDASPTENTYEQDGYFDSLYFSSCYFVIEGTTREQE